MAHLHQEIEVRFLEIDVPALTKRLKDLGAVDHGDDLFREIIFYDNAGTFRKERKMVRIRKTKKQILLAYKQHQQHTINGTVDYRFVSSGELAVDNLEKTVAFLEQLGLEKFREQEKKRHSYALDRVQIDIDTWPFIPTYVELEGKTEKALRDIAKKLGLDWKKAVFENAGTVIQKYYHIDVFSLKQFTFNKMV